MDLRNYVRQIINEVIGTPLNEYNEQDSFLSNFESAQKYAYDNIDEVSEAFDDYNEDQDNIQASYARDNYIDLIHSYVEKYNELKNHETVTIFRLIKLNSIKDLDIKNIGKHWSFSESGVGAYGENHPNRAMMKTGNPFVLEGDVSPKYIDWIYGFHSFIWYGEDQWECALDRGASVEINSINGKELEIPIIAKVGEH